MARASFNSPIVTLLSIFQYLLFVLLTGGNESICHDISIRWTLGLCFSEKKGGISMKKLLVLMLSLLLIGALASAEDFTPSMFLGSRGLMVMDENQMNSMGGSSGDTAPAEAMHGLSYGVLALPQDEGTASIVFFDGEKFYAAFDMSSMFGGSAIDEKGHLTVSIFRFPVLNWQFVPADFKRRQIVSFVRI
jgi:hypothetical protein